jgi:hypothetical protein
VFSAFDLIWQSMRLVSLLVGGLLADAAGIRPVCYLGGALLVAAALAGLTLAGLAAGRRRDRRRNLAGNLAALPARRSPRSNPGAAAG